MHSDPTVLSALLDSEADPEEAAQAWGHLRECTQCRALYEELESVSAALHEVDERAHLPSSETRERVLSLAVSAYESERARVDRLRPARLVGAAAAIALVGLLIAGSLLLADGRPTRSAGARYGPVSRHGVAGPERPAGCPARRGGLILAFVSTSGCAHDGEVELSRSDVAAVHFFSRRGGANEAVLVLRRGVTVPTIAVLGAKEPQGVRYAAVAGGRILGRTLAVGHHRIEIVLRTKSARRRLEAAIGS